MKKSLVSVIIISFLIGCGGPMYTLDERMMMLSQDYPIRGRVISIDEDVEDMVGLESYRLIPQGKSYRVEIKLVNLEGDDIVVDYAVRWYSFGARVETVNENWVPLNIMRNDYGLITFAIPNDRIDKFELLLQVGGE